MRIPVLPMTTDEDNDVLAGHVFFDSFTPRMEGKTVRTTAVRIKSGTSEEERGTVLIMDVKGLQRRNINDVLLKRLRIRGMRSWFLTNIESVDDIFDAFNTDAEAVLVPMHTVRSEEELEDILSVSDSAIPAIFVRNRCTQYLRRSIGAVKAAEEAFGKGFATVAVLDLDGSMTDGDWIALKDRGDIIPCSFTKTTKDERFEELGFGRFFTVPE